MHWSIPLVIFAVEALAAGSLVVAFNRLRARSADQRAASRSDAVPGYRQLDEELIQVSKMESLGLLASGVAHDFNNILTVILGATEFVIEDLRTAGVDTDNAMTIADAADRASTLTGQLLSFVRKQALAPEVLDLNKALLEVENMTQRLIGADIELRLDLAPELYPVLMSPDLFEQVVLNLVANARDAMPDGGALTITTANTSTAGPEPQGVTTGELATVSVEDTGNGMTRELRARVFEPFYTTKERSSATGLGLSMCQGIAEQAGGHITCESQVGVGARFTVHLPRATRLAEQPGPEGPFGPPTPPPGPLPATRGMNPDALGVDDESPS